MTEAITWVGLDAHKASISIAMLLPGQRQPMEWQTANQPAAVRRLARKLVRVFYCTREMAPHWTPI